MQEKKTTLLSDGTEWPHVKDHYIYCATKIFPCSLKLAAALECVFQLFLRERWGTGVTQVSVNKNKFQLCSVVKPNDQKGGDIFDC